MPLDCAPYRQHVDHFDLSEERKIELIAIVARIMESFIDLAFLEAPEQNLPGTAAEKSGAESADAILSTEHLHSSFNDAAHERRGEKGRP